MHNPSRSQLLRRPRVPRMLYESCGGFLSGLLLAGTYVGNMTSPLPIAIAANLGSAGAVSVLAGSLISYLISNTMLDNLPLLFALVVVVCLRVMKRPAKTSAGIACSTGLCVFFSGIVVSLLFHASGAEVIGYTMTAALTGCASYFMHAVFASVRSTGKIPLRSTDGCAAAVVLILTVAAFSCYGIPSMNAGGIISVAVTLIGAKKFRCAGGVICGALSACGAILGSPEAGMPLLILPVGGLLVGYLAEKNRFLIAGVFFLFSLMALITFGTSLLQISAVINLFLGSAAFLFLDSSWLDKWLSPTCPTVPTTRCPCPPVCNTWQMPFAVCGKIPMPLQPFCRRKNPPEMPPVKSAKPSAAAAATSCGAGNRHTRKPSPASGKWNPTSEQTCRRFRRNWHIAAGRNDCGHCFPAMPPTAGRHDFWRHGQQKAARYFWNSWQPQKTCCMRPVTICISATAAN